MKVLVSDNLAEVGIKMLRAAKGIQVDVRTGLAPKAIKAAIKDYDALVIRSATQVTETLLRSATRLNSFCFRPSRISGSHWRTWDT